jgi:hypothetical protein
VPFLYLSFYLVSLVSPPSLPCPIVCTQVPLPHGLCFPFSRTCLHPSYALVCPQQTVRLLTCSILWCKCTLCNFCK